MAGGDGSESFNTADSTLPKASELVKTMLASSVQTMTGFTVARSFAAATPVDMMAMHANNSDARAPRKVSEPLEDANRLRILDLSTSTIPADSCLTLIALFHSESNLNI